MKNPFFPIILVLLMFICSCASKKEIGDNQLYNGTWELEYMSGTRIAFEGLYPNKKPQISFNKTNNEVSGNNSCNGYSAAYYLQGYDISFGDAGPTTMMYCGDGEQQFMDMMKKIKRYSIDKDGKLNLMIEEVPMMRFKKIEDN